jgi:hypothetical protein
VDQYGYRFYLLATNFILVAIYGIKVTKKPFSSSKENGYVGYKNNSVQTLLFNFQSTSTRKAVMAPAAFAATSIISALRVCVKVSCKISISIP